MLRVYLLMDIYIVRGTNLNNFQRLTYICLFRSPLRMLCIRRNVSRFQNPPNQLSKQFDHPLTIDLSYPDQARTRRLSHQSLLYSSTIQDKSQHFHPYVFGRWSNLLHLLSYHILLWRFQGHRGQLCTHHLFSFLFGTNQNSWVLECLETAEC